MSNPDKVLVIGDDTRSFLATVRSLGRKGLEVHVAPYDLSSPSLSSRYISKVHLLPYYLDGGAAWLQATEDLLRREKFCLVIPCDERALLPLLKHGEMLGRYTTLSIPDERSFDLFFDKHQTRSAAALLDIPVAPGRVISSRDTAAGIAAEFGLPVIMKCRRSYTWPDLYVRTGTKMVHTETELAQWLNKNPILDDNVLVEHVFEGFGIGVSVLCKQGQVLQAFEHHRVQEVRGSSYYRKSMPVEASRLDAVAKMVAHANFTGIAMFEFKANSATGQWILLEVNARPWGSLPLPVALGVDFPYWLYRLLVKNETTPALNYRSEVYGRNLVPDLWQAVGTAKALGRKPLAMGSHILKWLWDFRRLFSGREHHDCWVRDDPRPGALELKSFAAYCAQKVRSKLLGAAPLRTGLRQMLPKISAGDKPVSILFLCQGNICRSPYAELKLRQLLQVHQIPFDVSSAGMLPRNRRPSPPLAIQAARQHGVDLAVHRSRHAWDDMVQSASFIVLFDCINLNSLGSRYPDALSKAYFLGELESTAGPATEVRDPEGQDVAYFDATYRKIDQCLENFVAAALPAFKTRMVQT